VARSRAGTIVRPVHDLHPLRNHRCRRPAELAGATGGAEWRWHCAVAMNRDQRRALRLLAGSPLGVTEAIMLAHGFTNATLDTFGAGWAGNGGTAGSAGRAAADQGYLAAVGPTNCARTPSMRILR
jgi:hypothetical protein